MMMQSPSIQVIRPPIKRRTMILWIGLAIAVRFLCVPDESYDYIYCLDPWYNYIVEHGGFAALKDNFANYTPLYLYWLAIAATWLSWLPQILAIKLLGMAADFLLAYLVYRLVKLQYPQGRRPMLALVTVLFAPTIVINSSLWGQCDVLYTTGLVGCLYYLCTNRKVLAWLSYGLGFALKLQAVWLGPFLLGLWLKRFVKFWHFLLIPLVYLVTIIPAGLIGRPLQELLLIYWGQANENEELTKNAPNLYQWISNDHYSTVMPLGMAIAVLGVSWLCWSVWRSKVKIEREFLVSLFFTSVLMVPFLLPKMHDRYFYPADVGSIIFAYYYPQYTWMPIVMQLGSLLAYASGDVQFLLKYCGIAIAVVLFVTLRHLYQNFLLPTMKAFHPSYDP